MTPEAKCGQCGEGFTASTLEQLRELELQHHKESKGKECPGIHACFTFVVRDGKGRPKAVDLFKRDKLWESEEI